MLHRRWALFNPLFSHVSTRFLQILVNMPHSRGGGVALLIKNRTACESIEAFCKATDDFQMQSVLTENALFPIIYRPPHTNFAVFLTFIESILSLITNKS